MTGKLKKAISFLLAVISVFVLFALCSCADPSAGEDDELAGYSETQRELIAEIRKIGGEWSRQVENLVKANDPEARRGETVFYGASNFARWYTMEADLAPYKVVNNAFGGSTDRDLLHWAEFLLYAYEPQCIFFQTGSNDYVESEKPTDAEKVAESMEFKKEMFSKIHERLPDAKLVVMSGLLLPKRSEYTPMTMEINKQLKAYCGETDYMVFVDAEAFTYFAPLGMYDESKFVIDGIHLTEEAQKEWAEQYILPVMEELALPKAA